MPTALRSCLFQPNGRIRLLLPTFTKALLGGKAALPEYAGETLRHAMVSLEVDEWRRPIRITGIATSVWDFDAAGDVKASVRRRHREGLKADRAVRDQPVSGTVVELAPRLRRKRWRAENHWKVGVREMNQIIMAIWRPVHRRS